MPEPVKHIAVEDHLQLAVETSQNTKLLRHETNLMLKVDLLSTSTSLAAISAFRLLGRSFSVSKVIFFASEETKKKVIFQWDKNKCKKHIVKKKGW